MSYVRTNRNSLRQFMKTRERFVHVSKAPLLIPTTDPDTGVVAIVVAWPKGTTYRKPKEAA
jgi:hypothetical protein